jgi:hypothetical protein
MTAKLRAEFTATAGISGIPPGRRHHSQILGSLATCDAAVA